MTKIPDCKQNHNAMIIGFVKVGSRDEVKVTYPKDVDVVKVYGSDETNPQRQKVWICKVCHEIKPIDLKIPLRGEPPVSSNIEKYFPQVNDEISHMCFHCKKQTMATVGAVKNNIVTVQCHECHYWFNNRFSERSTADAMMGIAYCGNCKGNVEFLIIKDEMKIITELKPQGEVKKDTIYELDLRTKKCPVCGLVNVLENRL